MGVRRRFAILYAALFLVSGAALLGLTNVLANAADTEPAPGQVPGPAPALAQRVRELEAQLSDVHAIQSRQLLVGSVIALLVMAAVSVLLGSVVAGRVLRPLRTITAATRRISAENLHERLAVAAPTDEVKELADTIDGLLERLEVSFAAQRGFVANASHELRTPLATMRASLDVAVAKPDPVPPATLALAGRLRTELDRVDELLEGFLVLARAQHGALGERVPVSLTAVAAQALAGRRGDISARNLTVETDLGPAAWTDGNPTLLARAVDNLIDNAIRHNTDGGWVRVATGAGPATGLTVETSGPVLDPDRVARLAQPFQRLAADRTGSENGSGLGLSIVDSIADAHGGRLELRARAEGGLRAELTLPAGVST